MEINISRMSDELQGYSDLIFLVYTGMVVHTGGNYHNYRQAEPGEEMLSGEERSWNKPLAPGRPGAIFAVAIVERFDNRISIAMSGAKKPTWVGTWPDQEQVLKWQAAHEANVRYDKAYKAAKKEWGRNVVWERLDPIREAYLNLGRAKRAQLLSAIVWYISR